MNGISIEKRFITLGLIFGLLFIFLIPPLQAPDEDSHFKKSFLVSSLHPFPIVNAEGKIGNYIPEALMNFENKLRPMMGNMDVKYSYKDQYFDSHLRVQRGQSLFTEYSTSQSNPILFLPQAAGMLFVKATLENPIFTNDNISPINYVYGGRIFNLAFFLTCCYYAIKNIPFFKNGLFLLCLMPMTMILASSLSYDAIIIGTIFLYLSFVLKLIYSDDVKSISKKNLYALIVFSVLLIQFKQVYFPLLLLVLLIPLSKFRDKKQKYTWISIIVSSGVLAYLLWTGLMKLILRGSVVADTNAGEQIHFILTSPFSYVHILLHTFKTGLLFYLNSFIGNLGWLDTNFPVVFIVVYFVLLLAAFLFNDHPGKVRIKGRDKGLFAILGILVVVLIESALYITWTSIPEIGGVGNPVVSGVQGRYFIPVSLVFFLLLAINSVNLNQRFTKIKDGLNMVIPKFAIFSLAFTIVILFLRYWVPSP
ncbi:DUF2142 domain-containing protein [Paenibacillus sp. NFR01]|uniref:DUF2142 domain-containing protein n=1 Tax=Paenibacillus sp. NFR01 TaxID=1566279 RepID=UPI0008C99C4F|nr:DUF2142 domain-containing protein [Paenibacillus sp. NFR01]SEU15380.1 Uncharacterized membrane protein [Paenibacillus sp. NFR01]